MATLDPDQAILNGAVRGMLSALDPFSAFFDRDQFELLQQQARGEALGFGSILYVQPGKLLVLQTALGSPSWRAGLGPGDEIVEINGTRIDRLDFNSLIALLQRAKSRPVRLGVIHPGKVVPQDFALRPAQVALPTVDKSFLLAPGIGYIHLAGFEAKTSQEVMDALKQLQTWGLKGLLLDLRDNHGGMLEAALGVTSLFLKPGLVLLTVRGRNLPEQSYQTPSSSFHFDLPLIVLVNGNTASAAEVVAAALQDHDRALIVGEPTFGKGVVETVMGLSERTGLALTTAQYFTPSGRSIQRPLPGTALATSDREAGIPKQSASPALPAPQSTAPDAGRTQPATQVLNSKFHTDNRRPVSAGGGVSPDVAIPARTLDPWVTFLDQRGAFTGFASEYVTSHNKVEKTFEPDSELLDNFKEFLGREQIRVPEDYWSKDRAYLKMRIKTEILNLVYGLAFGEEVETRADAQVQRAATLFAQISRLLEPWRRRRSGAL